MDPRIPPPAVHLWIARARHTPPSLLVALARRHEAVEGLQIPRLVQAEDWMRLRARLLLAEMLVAHRGSAGPSVLRQIPSGRMVLQQADGLSFSVSHADSLVGCAMTREVDIGLDIERLDRGAQVLELGSEFFCDPEQAELLRLSGAARLDHAVSLWTLKEAYSKAVGKGLAMKFSRIGFTGIERKQVRWQIGRPWWNAARWRNAWRDCDGHRIALLVKARSAGDLGFEVRDHSSLGAAAPRLLHEAARLHPLVSAPWASPALAR